MRHSHSFTRRLLATGITVGTVPLVIVAFAVLAVAAGRVRGPAGTERLAKDDLQHVADLVYDAVAIYSEALREQTGQSCAWRPTR